MSSVDVAVGMFHKLFRSPNNKKRKINERKTRRRLRRNYKSSSNL